MIEFDINKIKNELGIRAVAAAAIGRDKDLREIEVSCDCNGNFLNARCKYFRPKPSLKCNSRCHLKKSSMKKCCENR